MPAPARLATSSLAALSAAALVTALGTQVAGASAAPAGHRSGQDDQRVTSRLLAGSSPQARSAVAAARKDATALRISPADGLRVKDAARDSDGATHVHLNRTYHGLNVLGGDLIVHRDASGRVLGASQTLTHALTLSTKPKVTAKQAKAKFAKAAGTPHLVVDAVGHAPRLSWVVTTGGTRADGTPSRIKHYVDASTGKQLRSEQQIETVDGNGVTLYSGTVPLDLTKSGSTYQLKSASRGNTYTTDMKNAQDSYLCQVLGSGCSTGTIFTSSTTTFGNGSNSNRATAGADAQYGSDKTWDFYKATFGRNGIFGTGKGSYNRVHYGKNYVNAFWDGTKMTYGDGDGTNYGPLVSLDVAGHEMSHGVTENTAGLTYSGESGGLNEATSDIFGTMVEFYANNAKDPGDYLIGEQFDLKKHLGFRRMDNPASDGSSLNCYSAAAGSADVHYSSGIANHFFYLLSEGSGAKTLNGVSYNSPTCNGSTVSGIGRDAAAAIWYRALTTYFTSSTNYSQARTATLNAAKDLYGAGSTNYNAVASAWSAVAVS